MKEAILRSSYAAYIYVYVHSLPLLPYPILKRWLSNPGGVGGGDGDGVVYLFNW